MPVSVEFLPGPLTSEASRASAENSLKRHSAIQKGAAYALEQLEGRWIAAIVHEAAEPPFMGGGPADADEGPPGPKSEGPDDAEPSEGDAGPPPSDGGSDDGGGDSDSPPKHDKGGEKAELHQLMDLVHQIAEALGIPAGLGGDPMGPDGPGGPPGAPPGPPPGPPGAGGPPAVQKVIHDRVTKPGETPPGGTPLGAPAFSSVRPDHPWAHLAGRVASFHVSSEIGSTPLPTVQRELQGLASEINHRVSRLREDRDEHGNRVAVAVITAH